MPEELIIQHCSPTLAGIKTGNLFTVSLSDRTDIVGEVRNLNNVFRVKGLRVIPLKVTEDYALIYVYRPEHLKKDLSDPKALKILQSRGYSLKNPEGCIVQLAGRLKNEKRFPHEIGLFLGYPPSDVECFMKHPCTGVKCCGCWKAYSEPEKAMATFNRYRECTKKYMEMHEKGKSLSQLAVITAGGDRQK
jgi:hypothetical protein